MKNENYNILFGMSIVYVESMSAHSLAYIERMLRAGKTPEELGGVKIGEGVCKAAYLFNNSFVVKENAQNGRSGMPCKNPPKWIRKYGARAPRTYKAGRYIIQEYVTVLDDIDEPHKAWDAWREMYNNRPDELGSDVHQYNCGIDKDGKLVVFDW